MAAAVVASCNTGRLLITVYFAQRMTRTGFTAEERLRAIGQVIKYLIYSRHSNAVLRLLLAVFNDEKHEE